jgi:hypothetical protein
VETACPIFHSSQVRCWAPLVSRAFVWAWFGSKLRQRNRVLQLLRYQHFNPVSCSIIRLVLLRHTCRLCSLPWAPPPRDFRPILWSLVSSGYDQLMEKNWWPIGSALETGEEGSRPLFCNSGTAYALVWAISPAIRHISGPAKTTKTQEVGNWGVVPGNQRPRKEIRAARQGQTA